MKYLLVMIGLPLALAINANSYSQTPQNAADLRPSINACLHHETNVVIILPTGEATKAAGDRIGRYARAVFKNRGVFLEDTAALGKDLSPCAIITYGTPSGNLWVKQNLKGLPVVMAKDKIVTDHEFKGTNLRFISCWFNPANAAKPWIIYTAQDEKDVVGINGVFHGPAQFHVARNEELLQSGYYSRIGGNWTISDQPDFGFPALTRKQMYEDYDAFTNIVFQVFPLMEVNRQIYGLDIRQMLSKNRSRIETITQTGQFADLINRMIVACRGSHFWVGVFYSHKDDYQGFVDEDAYKWADKYQLYLTQACPRNLVQFPLLYFKGNYYTLYDFVYDGVAYSKGMKVLTCNGKTPDAIVGPLAQSGASLQWDCVQWDYDLNKYYATEFYQYASGTDAPAKSNSPVLMQLEQKDGTTVNLKLSPDNNVISRKPQTDRTALVSLVDSNILYIRLPAMDRQSIGYYQKELLKYQNQPIQKVVIDIRDNGGGSDDVWHTLLSLLMDKTITLHPRLAVKKSDIIQQYVARSPDGQVINKSLKTEKISFLNNEEFQVMEITNVLSPETNSLHLNCKVYVLSEHIYSSAGGFMNICKDNDQLVSVGLPNNMILGRGGDPVAFSLPHSKLTFTLEPVLDLTDARTAKDVHHIDVKVRIAPTLEQLLDYYNTGEEVGLEKRLNEHDPFFKKVLETD
jgi:hypothetical protein